MPNEIVKYANEMNTVLFKEFTAKEMDLFFSIVSRMRDKGTETVRFSWNELRQLSDYRPTAIRRFVDDLESTYNKMLKLNYRTEKESVSAMRISRFVLFTGFDIGADINEGHIDSQSGYVDITVNPKLLYVLNDIDVWTRYSLEEFVGLKSTYSKTLFRLLKQFRTTGRLVLSMEQFRELLDVPDSYRVGQIDQKILKPAQSELKASFKNLRIQKNKSKHKGRRVMGYTFTFHPEAKNANDFKQTHARRETLPDWAQEDYAPEKDEQLTPEEEARLKDRLARTRSKK